MAAWGPDELADAGAIQHQAQFVLVYTATACCKRFIGAKAPRGRVSPSVNCNPISQHDSVKPIL